jgi:hypothetical protein
VPADMLCVIGFEMAIVRLMKVDNDRHYLSGTQLPWTITLLATILHKFSFPERQEDLAEIIYADKQFE